MGSADIHIHTIYSYDATTTVRGVLKQASSVGLNVIAVTDHDDIRGAFDARELAAQYELEVVPGVEVSTRNGHLLALYVEKMYSGETLPEHATWMGITLGGYSMRETPARSLPNGAQPE